ncbi:COMM domain-containing protein 4-like isoform X1 [Maniola jurtina]|uniref:COMM domain-containing protein 4-like isoform X1 n=1 Tax=Maniola jurtina TaxID=191418 RepID=UPI001E687DD4|nr:COMM domain-containing protein 4-like isoform X1 [Maniola jurtina]
MKFKFCSDGDCPLWALAALHALGSLPAPIFRTLLHRVVEEQPDDGIMDILKDTNLSSREECARAAAVLRWTLKQAQRCGCSGVQLARDLLVLGVPRAHAAALADAADSGRAAHEAQARTHGFMVNKLTDIATSPGPEGTVDTITLSLQSDDVFTGTQRTADLIVDKSQVCALLQELRTAKLKMDEIDIE